MWTCPKCGQSFEHKDQPHFCVEGSREVEAYILDQPETIQPLLHQVRAVLRRTLPQAKEKIAWRMPTYWDQHNIIHFAAFKNHLGIYPGEEAIRHFSDRLKEYKTSKGAWQLPYNKPMPFDLIAEIAQWCHETGHHH